ncbi:MAG: lipid-A-disaccharide synthase [Rickettsiales bacterium]|jgi:lipid-A-disaccharide synthase|nr:lipid-A-disaccharide synthase [Rickettsiales bacterium]
MKKKIFITAGEKSGDLLGSRILRNLDKNEFEFYGIGGEAMEKAGLKSIFPIEDLSVMGIFEILPRLFKILKRIRQTSKAVLDIKPDIFITIDSPVFSFRVAKKVKKQDRENRIKKIHFIAPSVWAHRKNRAKKISKLYDLLLCILPFEPPYFEKYGLKTKFVGHPMFYSDAKEYEFNLVDINYNKNSNIISITTGSRKNEVKRFLPITLNVIKKLQKNFNFTYYFLATNDTFSLLKKLIPKNEYIKVTKDAKIIQQSMLGITKSGTNALEFSAFSVPCVVYYKFNRMTDSIIKMKRRKSVIKFANLVNVVANREIIPEFVLDDCTESNIYDAVLRLITSEDERTEQIKNAGGILKQLGYKDNKFSSRLITDEIQNV